MFDLRRLSVVGPDDRHDIKAACLLEQVVLSLKMERRQGDSSLLLKVDRFRGRPLPPGFYLNENQNVTVARDQVDLAL